jgi:hypothetical protein
MPVLEKIFAELADYSKTMGQLHNNFFDIVNRDIARFLEKTNDVNNQARWQAGTVMCLTLFSASFRIAGKCFSKAETPVTTGLDLRQAANGACDNVLKAISQKLSDHDFLRETTKVCAKIADGAIQPANLIFQSRSGTTEAKSNLLEKVIVPEGQSKKSAFLQEMQQANAAVIRFLESKSKGA